MQRYVTRNDWGFVYRDDRYDFTYFPVNLVYCRYVRISNGELPSRVYQKQRSEFSMDTVTVQPDAEGLYWAGAMSPHDRRTIRLYCTQRCVIQYVVQQAA